MTNHAITYTNLTFLIDVVCYTAVFSVVTQRSRLHPMIPRKKIKDASKGNGEKKFPLHLYPNLN